MSRTKHEGEITLADEEESRWQNTVEVGHITSPYVAMHNCWQTAIFARRGSGDAV
jgi:hypothetical protein